MSPKIEDLFRHRTEHEERIARHFGEDLVFDGEAPVFDQPLYLMAFTNRSGSNLLGEHLNATGQFSGFAEALNWDHVTSVAPKIGAATFPDYIAKTVRQNRRPGTLFGLKAAFGQIMMLRRWRITAMFPEIRLIHILRGDILGQAVSYSIAEQTGRWTSDLAARAEPRLELARISHYLNMIALQNSCITVLASAAHLKRVEVRYEGLVARPEVAVNRVLDFAGLPPLAGPLPAPRLEKQADAVNRRFVAAFRQQLLPQ